MRSRRDPVGIALHGGAEETESGASALRRAFASAFCAGEESAIPIQNAEIAERLERYADLLAIQGANPFRVRAYQNAALTIRSSPRRLAEMVASGEDLSELHAVGPTIAHKIVELVETGHLGALEGLERREGPELADLLRIPGLGPKRVRVLHELLGVRTLDELARAARQGEIAKLPHFGHKTGRAISSALERGTFARGRLPWAEAEPIAESLLDLLGKLPGVERAIAAGSYRRRSETVGDLDLCVGAIHSHLGLSARKQTDRMLRAMDHPRLQVLAHPTGRLIGSRDTYRLELEHVIEGAAERSCWLELNAQPLRLDLSDVWVRVARDAGVRISIASDAHAPEQLDYMRLGVAQARRGWIERGDVVNTRSLARLRELMRT